MTADRIDICVFAHNEGRTIGRFLTDLSRQTVFSRPDLDARVFVMANGCTDDTVVRAQGMLSQLPKEVAQRISIASLEKGGKSRTWNVFTHAPERGEAKILAYIDADIGLPEPNVLERMCQALIDRPGLEVFVSRPVKDVTHYGLKVGPVARLIAMGGGMLDDYKTSISGQLYVMRSATARRVTMPVGLPVEDGFLRAMVLTDLLSREEDVSRIDGDPSVYHVYESLRTLRGLLRHQTRIVVGNAINSAIYAKIRREAGSVKKAHELLDQSGRDEEWLARLIRTELPRAPYGYVPFGFAHKRLGALSRDNTSLTGKNLLMLVIGLAFDAAVYAVATVKMARGTGAGYW